MQSNIATKNNKLYVTIMIVEDGNDNTWYLDKEITNHMLHDIKSFVTYNKWGKGQVMYLNDNSKPNNWTKQYIHKIK
jgi:hypothetical protein